VKNIYCISGLGADERIFKRLSVKGANLVHVPWVPFDKHDEIPCYAQKMSSQIREKDPIVLGLSFGGMLAVEIGKIRHLDRVFAISTAKTKDELVQGTGGFLSLLIKYDVIPAPLYTMPNTFLLQRFGAKTAEEKKLLTDILYDTDPWFVKWAMRALLEWKSETFKENVFHIHGTADKIIMPGSIKPDFWIEGGTHMMIYNRAEEIGKIISENL
jgi:hypothetical protein